MILNFQQEMATKTGPHPTLDFVRAAALLFTVRTETTIPPNHTPPTPQPPNQPTCIPCFNLVIIVTGFILKLLQCIVSCFEIEQRHDERHNNR